MAAESKFGILIETQERGSQAFDHVLKQEEALRKSTDDLMRKTEQASKANAAFADSFRGVSDRLANAAGPLGGLSRVLSSFSLAAGIAVGAAGALGVSSIIAAQSIGQYQEKIELAMDATDLTARQIGGLQVAAANSGRTFDSIQPSIAIFTRRVAEARDGSEDALQTFQRLGITLEDLRKQSTGDLLGQIGAGIGVVGDAADRSRVLFELFGRSGQSMLAILRQDMTETEQLAERLGITLTKEQAAIAKAADSSSDQFALAWEGAMNRIKLAMAPLGITLLKFGSTLLGGGVDSFLDFGTPYSAPTFGPTAEEAQQALALQRVEEEKLAEATRKLAEARIKAEAEVLAGMRLEAGLPRPWRESPLMVRTGLAGNNLRAGSGYADERMPGGQLEIGEDLFTDLDRFLAEFEDFPGILERATDATGRVDEAMVGFIATLEHGGETALEFGERMGHMTLQLANEFGETMGQILVTVATGLDQTEDQFIRFIRALIKAAQQAASGAISQAVGGIGGEFLGGIVSGIIGGLIPLPSSPAPSFPSTSGSTQARGGNTYTFNINSIDPAGVREVVRRDILPEIDRSERRGVR